MKTISDIIYYSSGETAQILGVASRTVLRWAHKGYVILNGVDGKPRINLTPYVHPFNGYLYIPKTIVEEIQRAANKDKK